MTDLKPLGAEAPASDEEALSLPRLLLEDSIQQEIAAAIDRIAKDGYPGHLEVAREHVRCCGCQSKIARRDVRWQEIQLISGLSEMFVVGGIRCPICHERGTATASFDMLHG